MRRTNQDWNVRLDRFIGVVLSRSRPDRRRTVPVVFVVSHSWPVLVTIERPECHHQNRVLHVLRATQQSSVSSNRWG